MDAPKTGDRIELLTYTEPGTGLAPGAVGTVLRIEDRRVCVRWDSGVTFTLTPGWDAFRVLP